MSALTAAKRARCTLCRHEWKRDPVFEVKCPTCKAKVGAFCKRPSGHSGPLVNFHAARDLAASDAGAYDHECIEPDMEEAHVEGGTCGPQEEA